MQRTPEAYTGGILAAVIEPWVNGLAKVDVAIQTDNKVRGRLFNAAEESADKMALINSILPADTPEQVRNFLGVLIIDNSLDLLDDIVATLMRIIREETGGGRQRALVTSAVALTDAEQESIRARIIERFGPALDFEFQIQPDILGGLVIRVGDKLIDDSVRGRVDALRMTLGVRAA